MFSNFLLKKDMNDKKPVTSEDDGTARLILIRLNCKYFLVEMAGAMMVERAQSIPAMESIDPKEYLAK